MAKAPGGGRGPFGGVQTASPTRKVGEPAILNVLLGEHRVTETASSTTAVVTHIVEKLSGAGPLMLFDALNAPGVEQGGDAFVGKPDLIVTRRAVELVDGENTMAKVTITFGPPGDTPSPLFGTVIGATLNNLPQLEVGTSLVSKTTNKDVNGDLITVSINVPTTLEEEEETGEASKVLTQAGEVEVMVPLTTFVYRRKERGAPGDKSKFYTGTTNSIDVFGDPANFWLCTGINGFSEDGGETYNVTYSFTRADDDNGWDASIIFIDPDTGQPSRFIAPDRTDIVQPGGTRDDVSVYRRTDFFALRLTL